MARVRHHRKTVLLVPVAGLSVLLLTGSLGASAASSTSTWTQPSADAAHSNRAANETAITTANVKNLVPEYTVGGLPPYGVCGGGASGTGFAATATTLFSYDGRRVVATNLASGNTLWRSATDTDGDGRDKVKVALAGNQVIVAGESSCISSSSASGFIRAFNQATGALTWTGSLDVEEYPITNLIVSGSTIVLTGDLLGRQSTDIAVRALNAANGHVLWQRRDCAGFGPDSAGLFASGDDIITGCGAISFTGGTTHWTKPAGWQFWRADPTGTSGAQIYATNPAGKLTALNAAGAPIWTSTNVGGPVLATGPARIFATCDGGFMCALNRTTGAREWRSLGKPTAAISAGNVVFPMPLGVPLNATTGAQLVGGTAYEDSLDYLLGGPVAVAGGNLLHQRDADVDVWQVGPSHP